MGVDLRVILAASVIVRNELARYLEPCVAHLLEFCDQVFILDDGSTDGWVQAMQGVWGKDGARVMTKRLVREGRNGEPDFYLHADARNELLQFTLAGWPTHILAIDADEFISDGQALRRACEGDGDVFTLTVQEVWEAGPNHIFTREDGGWRSHEIGVLWRVDAFRSGPLVIVDKGHATGRTPDAVGRVRGVRTNVALQHWGWTNVAERAVRYARYRDGDGGKFHARQHIESIMWPPRKVRLTRRLWPAELLERRDVLLARAGRL